ncbi:MULTISPECIES: hypothetical protein [Agrobacterium]|uniref:Uncharacterized protein n=1 Tax=Agrobacterium tumefaciens TaxID=358 RepID=A0AAE6BQB1_AGRTU|nr:MULTISPECIES: hypothetical protein [Agrobacterium]ANV24124.1 hypothetical protein BA939_09345 [Rhizobium sp. S41]MCA2370703.1 hypothetical protein [Agrobacterium tomkonis CIP 111-78]QCM01108.1 hypothetical protein CFBP6624_13835 [Agrobacterium tumefaciens]QWW73766.1 hypothetical protein KP800_13875 [Agrobacterium pusense]
MSQNTAKLSIPRQSNGLFAKGGPGRPVGAKGKKSREALEAVKSFGPEALRKLQDAVSAGERWSIEFVLDKLLPTNRAIEFEDATPEDVKEALKAGDISAAEAKDIATALAKLAEIGELSEMKERLAALEKALQDGNSR